MAIKELFYDNRPQVLLDPRASQRIDPRFKFTRNSDAWYADANGYLQRADANRPRLDYDPLTGSLNGLLLEKAATNLITNAFDAGQLSSVTVNSSTILDPFNGNQAFEVQSDNNNAVHYFRPPYSGSISGLKTFSFYAKPVSGLADINSRIIIVVFGGSTVTAYFDWNGSEYTFNAANSSGLSGGTEPAANGYTRCFGVFAAGTGTSFANFYLRSTGTYTGSSAQRIYFYGFQREEGDRPTSLIPTTGTSLTRAADLLSIEAPLPASGSVYIDARAITANENDTLLSLKNSSNDKIDLAYLSNTSTYDSLALIANYDGTSKTSLPLPVPTTDRERNIITWGAQNYQYTRDSSRFATSLSSSVPTGLNQLSIGHDAVDPTKAFNGYINTVYAWSGELTPAVAEALVRNDLDPINADTYSPTGPAGSLALVINTQGASADGEKTFTLPAESAANDNDIVITWGDGTESGLDGADAEVGASGLTHTYPAAGIYPVWVEGQMENIYYNNIANAPDLLQIAAWGTNANGNNVFRTPSTMLNAFYGCTQMDFSTSARTTNLPDTSAVTNWYRAFRGCSSITGTFPAFNFSAATTFQEAWLGCSSMTAFVDAGNQTQNVTNFNAAWQSCASLTSFPEINTSAGTNFSYAWRNCFGLTSFPGINTSAGTNFSYAWQSCYGLTSFPLINTAAGTNFSNTWSGCSSLDNIVNAGEASSFPLINTASGTNFSFAWQNCSSFTIFPQLDTSAGTNFRGAWAGCSSLTSFPTIDTSESTSLQDAWRDCSTLNNIGVVAGATTSFPSINTAKCENFFGAWAGCSSLTIFPQLNTSAGTSFRDAWNDCSNLTSFPSITISAGTNFRAAWAGCSSLTSFPANFFDSWSGNPSDGCFYFTWDGCSSLTPASVVNILDSIAASGQSAPSGTGTGDKEITIDWDGTGDPATDAAAAITTLKSRNWDVVLNGVSQ